MTVYFLDSSALVKRYVTEKGSVWLQQLAEPESGHTLIVARISWAELLSALARLQREYALSPADINDALTTLSYDWATQYQVVEIDAAVINLAGELLFDHPLRAYDSVQLASALQLRPAFADAPEGSYVFLAADERLLSAARAEGLATQNPNEQP